MLNRPVSAARLANPIWEVKVRRFPHGSCGLLNCFVFVSSCSSLLCTCVCSSLYFCPPRAGGDGLDLGWKICICTASWAPGMFRRSRREATSLAGTGHHFPLHHRLFSRVFSHARKAHLHPSLGVCRRFMEEKESKNGRVGEALFAIQGWDGGGERDGSKCQDTQAS